MPAAPPKTSPTRLARKVVARRTVRCHRSSWRGPVNPTTVMIVPGEVLDAAQSLLGSAIESVAPTARGESRSTFRVTTADRAVVLKVLPAGDGVLANQRR